MHTLKMVVGGLAALGVFILAATLLGRRAADGARIFILPWLAASVINMVIGVYWASVPLSTRDSGAGRGVRRAGCDRLVPRPLAARPQRGLGVLAGVIPERAPARIRTPESRSNTRSLRPGFRFAG